MTKIPDWITKYNEANCQSSAGKAVRELIKIIEEFENPSNQNNKPLVKADVNACAPNREFKGTLKTYSVFTPSNRNILQIEVSGVENYIGNTLKVGDEVNIQHWR